MRAIESLIGSLGILLAGFVTIPFVAGLYGVQVSTEQGFKMGATFFLLRWAWLYVLRVYFSKRDGHAK